MEKKCSVKWCIIFIAVFAAAIVIAAGFKMYKADLTSDDTYIGNTALGDAKNGSYMVEGDIVTLKDGYYEKEAYGSASKMIIRYFGDDVSADLNGDGVKDSAFLLTREAGGSGTFYYLAALISSGKSFIGTNTVLLGDRIAPQTTEFRDGAVVVNYADRKPGEPFTAQPSVGVSRYFKLVEGGINEVQPQDQNGQKYLNYNNQEYNFSFSYPERYVFNPNVGYQYVTNNSLARVDVPESDFKGTNLGEASFIVGASRDAKVIKACLKAAPEERDVMGLEVINGTEMKVFSGSDPAAGNLYETKSYRAVKNGICYEATLLLHSGNIYNYEPGAVKEFDHEKFLGGLMKILNTLKIGD